MTSTPSAPEADVTVDSTESIGPIDYVFIEFPGNRFNGQVVPSLTALVAQGTVRILDLAFVTKDAAGAVTTFDIEEFEDAGPLLNDLRDYLTDVVGEEDLQAAGALLEPNSSAVMIVWENTWAAPFASAVRASGGDVIASGRIPGALVLEAMDSLTA